MKKKKRAPAESERINLKISMKNQFKYYSFSKIKKISPQNYAKIKIPIFFIKTYLYFYAEKVKYKRRSEYIGSFT
jgi:hypothetical protein